jgi:hypothetical protein
MGRFEWRYYGFILFARRASDGSRLAPFSQAMRRRDQSGKWEYRAVTQEEEVEAWISRQW